MSFVPPDDAEVAAVARLQFRLETTPDLEYKLADVALLRFYRGRKRDEDKAYNAVLKHIAWREENNVSSVCANLDKFQDELKSGKIVVKGYDLSGRPAVFIYAGKHDKNERDIEQMRMLIIYTLEELLKRARPSEERIMICFDMTGFKMSCMDYGTYVCVCVCCVSALSLLCPLHFPFSLTDLFLFPCCSLFCTPCSLF
jgi:hypothetical protein